MANYKANAETIRQLTDGDVAALLSTYQHRCLDEALLYRYIYSETDEYQQYTARRIKKLVDFNLIEQVDYGREFPALFLTTLGIETVKATSKERLNLLYQFEYGKKTLPLSSDLKMHPKIINHQMHLNSFAMELESYARPQGYFRYFDEKLMPPASNFMMPDAMAELSDFFVFLEMDMGTEAGGRLAQKWNSYRTFLNDPGPFYKEKPVVMLFIIDGVKNAELRKRNITSGFMAHIADRVNGKFEVYIDGVEALHDIVKTQLLKLHPVETSEAADVCHSISSAHGFSISQPPILKELDVPYSYYVRQLNADKKIHVIGNRPQEFLMDIWLDGRLSVLRNILYYQCSLNQIEKLTRRKLAYVVVVPSECSACALLKVLKITQPAGLFFTTPARLAERPWNKALFCIDQLWNLNHFADNSLSVAIHEKRLFRF